MTVPDTTKDATAAAAAATRAASDLLERLAERVGAKASATTVYGEPVVAEGVTIIPVAAITYGFGGGTGRETHATKNGEGGGGGGGAIARPIGYIEIAGGTAVFKPIRDPRRDILAPSAVALAAITTVRMALSLARRRKR